MIKTGRDQKITVRAFEKSIRAAVVIAVKLLTDANELLAQCTGCYSDVLCCRCSWSVRDWVAE